MACPEQRDRQARSAKQARNKGLIPTDKILSVHNFETTVQGTKELCLEYHNLQFQLRDPQMDDRSCFVFKLT